ncbi:TNT domain-containing protein [Catenulispora subtropica]|uniref:TNT domain-containing protein n=1 Tax=Catenulispora subtropica TaxID=450798 RepID=A0ABP5D366_9ACTN
MRSSRWCAGFIAAAGLAGSLLTGASASSAATVAGQVPEVSGHVLWAGPGAQAAEPSARPDTYGGSGQPRVCEGLVPYPIPKVYQPYFFCGDWRLGPKRLPNRGVLGNILEGYNRLGGLTAVQFLNAWWLPAADSGQGGWDYPKDDGFAHDALGQPIAVPMVLPAGQNLMVDRFGNESGTFLSPAGTKFGQRAIPPANLNTNDPRYPYNYHLYRVAKDVTVCAGPAAPAFEQPGGGMQYVTSSKVCPTLPTNVTVGSLVSNGSLVRLQVPVPAQEAAPQKENSPAK